MCTFVCVLSHFSCVWLFVTLWTVTHPAPLSMGFSGQEYWSGLPPPSPGDLPQPGIEPVALGSLALAGWFFTTSANFSWGSEALFLAHLHLKNKKDKGWKGEAGTKWGMLILGDLDILLWVVGNQWMLWSQEIIWRRRWLGTTLWEMLAANLGAFNKCQVGCRPGGHSLSQPHIQSAAWTLPLVYKWRKGSESMYKAQRACILPKATLLADCGTRFKTSLLILKLL